jgi:hypothetical protein
MSGRIIRLAEGKGKIGQQRSQRRDAGGAKK